MDTLTQVQRETAQGCPAPLGATLQDGGVNFAVFSQYAAQIILVLFDPITGAPTDTIKLNRTGNVWHTFVRGAQAGQLYGYRAEGEYSPAQGKRFNPYKLLLDPYARAVTGKFQNKDNLIFGYDVMSPDKDLVMDARDNAPVVPKSIVVDDAFDWQGDRPPGLAMDELVIYEVHVKGFTAHASSGVRQPGTYLGFVEKIPYLNKLGVNAVELMPIHEFFNRNDLLDKGLSDYWGYNSIAFFAPEVSYSTRQHPGCQVAEFKTLVRELHKAGIEVILDVVYNHTGEGNHLGPTLCLKGLDNPTYYRLDNNPEHPQEPYRYYINDSGCGNTLDAENPAAMNLVLDSLRYWVQVMHVDGFRFDLASILARAHGRFSQASLFFETISKDPVLSRVKMIAEPWDLTTYQVGNFPAGWSEWNGKFRDAARKFLKGDDGQAGDIARRLTGSADLYQEDGRKPYNSINLITCHDGFTLSDVYAYNTKHNEANGEQNRDGSDDNNSWNCGAEGPTFDEDILRLRKQMIKNALTLLMVSAGTPMICYGDEVMRTQQGNNNAYCQDNELTWFNWNYVEEHADIFNFCAKLIAFRHNSSILRVRRFFTGQILEGLNAADIAWFGSHLDTPAWEDPGLKTICYQVSGKETLLKFFLFFVFNMNHKAKIIQLPQHAGLTWFPVLDTSKKTGWDFHTELPRNPLRRQDKIYCAPRSVNILWGGPRP